MIWVCIFSYGCNISIVGMCICFVDNRYVVLNDFRAYCIIVFVVLSRSDWRGYLLSPSYMYLSSFSCEIIGMTG